MTKLKRYRRKQGVSVEQLLANDNIRLNGPQYSLIDTGKLLPTPEILQAICEEIGCTPLDLYEKPEDFDLLRIQKKMEGGAIRSNVTRFDSLPKGNPRLAVRLPQEEIEAVESDLHVLGYTSFGQYFRRVIKPMIAIQAEAKSKKRA